MDARHAMVPNHPRMSVFPTTGSLRIVLTKANPDGYYKDRTGYSTFQTLRVHVNEFSSSFQFTDVAQLSIRSTSPCGRFEPHYL